MLELEADHRRHAEIENAIRDLKHGVGLNHRPLETLQPPTSEWLARTGDSTQHRPLGLRRIGLGEQVVTTKTLRRAVRLPGRTDHPLGSQQRHTASATALALG